MSDAVDAFFNTTTSIYHSTQTFTQYELYTFLKQQKQ